MSEDLMENTTTTMEPGSAGRESDTTERFLTFSSDGLTFGVSTNYIIEIITNHMLTVLPMVPDFVKGIINLRGQIIPIIDIRLRMGKMEIDYTNTSCIIVLNFNSVNIGIIVDAVEQVIDIDCSKISPVPASNQQELVSGMVSLSDKNVVLLLDCEHLINN